MKEMLLGGGKQDLIGYVVIPVLFLSDIHSLRKLVKEQVIWVGVEEIECTKLGG